MTYVISDLHGYPPEELQRLLERAGFGEKDFLFVLGDCIDRNGDGGVALLRWLQLQPNVQTLLGNHEAMLLACSFLFEEITEESLDNLAPEQLGALSTWLYNGAEPTLDALMDLGRQDPEALDELLDFIRELPLYDTVTVGERDYLLVHAGLGGFRPDRPLSDYAVDELVWTRPAPEERYFENLTTILGHTPTVFYGSPGRPFRTDTWIDIDVGAASGLPPLLLRLDDGAEFYGAATLRP